MITFDKLWNDICTYNLESKYKYHDLRKGLKYANGCGSKGGYKFPDHLLWVWIVAACIIHDIEWKLARSFQDLLDANERFDNNLKRITDQESNIAMKWIRRQLISYYISGVELVGTPAYARERGFIDDVSL